MGDKLVYTVREASQLTNFTGEQIRNYCKEGRIGFKIGRGQAWQIPHSDLERLLTELAQEWKENL